MDKNKATIAEAIRTVLEPEVHHRTQRFPGSQGGGTRALGWESSTEPTREPSRSPSGKASFRRSISSKVKRLGIYLDQLDNYAAVACLGPDRRVLDCFTNQGGFALHCAKAGASSVRAVDISEGAVESTRRNAERNELEIDCVTENVFDYLKQAESEGERNTTSSFSIRPPSPEKPEKGQGGDARLQGDSSPGPQDSQPGRNPGDLLLQPPRFGQRPFTT